MKNQFINHKKILVAVIALLAVTAQQDSPISHILADLIKISFFPKWAKKESRRSDSGKMLLFYVLDFTNVGRRIQYIQPSLCNITYIN